MNYESHNIDIFKIVDYLLCKSDADTEDYISNLKLQKLLYYCQGFVLAITKKTLFINDIIAWEHGPVVKEVYNKYKDNGALGIYPPTDSKEHYYDEITQSEIGNIIDEVWDVYGQFSAWKLRNMTHAETPWQKTKRNNIISVDLLYEYFINQIENEENKEG